MKVTVKETQPEPAFKPLTITITLESMEEQKALQHLLSMNDIEAAKIYEWIASSHAKHTNAEEMHEVARAIAQEIACTV